MVDKRHLGIRRGLSHHLRAASTADDVGGTGIESPLGVAVIPLLKRWGIGGPVGYLEMVPPPHGLCRAVQLVRVSSPGAHQEHQVPALGPLEFCTSTPPL